MWETGSWRERRWVGSAYRAYSQGKHTLQELSLRYRVDKATLRRNFDCYEPKNEPVVPASHPVPVVFDATFFGRDNGWLIFRVDGRNIYWKEIVSETLEITSQALLHLKQSGWVFSSFTIDGRRGVIRLIESIFPSTPIQLCVFHQKAIIRRYLTANPKTPCGSEIKSLMSQMLDLDPDAFSQELTRIKKLYNDFLNEKNEAGYFVHRKLRSAIRSLTTNLPYFYTFARHPKLKIPNTTNSCDGSFAHWKSKVKIHRGLKKIRRAKMIRFLLKKP